MRDEWLGDEDYASYFETDPEIEALTRKLLEDKKAGKPGKPSDPEILRLVAALTDETGGETMAEREGKGIKERGNLKGTESKELQDAKYGDIPESSDSELDDLYATLGEGQDVPEDELEMLLSKYGGEDKRDTTSPIEQEADIITTPVKEDRKESVTPFKGKGVSGVKAEKQVSKKSILDEIPNMPDILGKKQPGESSSDTKKPGNISSKPIDTGMNKIVQEMLSKYGFSIKELRDFLNKIEK